MLSTLEPQPTTLHAHSVSIEAGAAANQDGLGQLPSPSPSHVSTSKLKTTMALTKPDTFGFKRPSLQTSAPKGTSSQLQNSTTFDSSTSFTRPDILQGQRRPSVTPNTSTVSKRKRKIEINLSSDEEDGSNFSPSADEEPDSSEDYPEKAQKHVHASKRARVRVISKRKAHNQFPDLNVPLAKGKNRLGFKVFTKSKAGTAAVSSPALSETPAGKSTPRILHTMSKPNHRPQLEPRDSTRRSSRHLPSPASVSANSAARKAKGKARKKIEQFSAVHESLCTETAIEEAEEQEYRLRSTLAGAVREMSIMPRPSTSAGHLHTRTDEDMVDACEDPIVDKGTFGSWTHARSTGDRHLAKALPSSHPNRADSDEDLDISDYTFVNGIILHQKPQPGVVSHTSNTDINVQTDKRGQARRRRVRRVGRRYDGRGRT